MIKGCSKKIYHIKSTGGKYFDEAYFILKGDDGTAETSAATLAEEAERIIKEASANYRPSKKRSPSPASRALSFAMGAFTSSSIIGIVALLMSL